MARRPSLRADRDSAALDPQGLGHDAIGVVDFIAPEATAERTERIEPAEPVRREATDDTVEQGPANDFAERLVRRFLHRFEDERTRTRMLRLLRSSFASAREGRVLYKVLSVTMINPVARATGLHASALKYEVVVGQLTGLAMMRYVLKVEPLASASVEDVVALMAPGIRATLNG